MLFDREPYNIELAHTRESSRPVEMHNLHGADHALARMSQEIASMSPLEERVVNERTLPFISEKYGISRKLDDYVVVPITIMASDLPNRNLVAFPFSRLSEFNPETKTLSYQSWRFAPCFQDHKNTDCTIASGVVLDVGISRMRKVAGDLWKVDTLCAFDRSRNPHLAGRILSGELSSYSMGAYVSAYRCSVCGSQTKRPSEPKCTHIPADRRTLNVYNRQGEPVLAYWNTTSLIGFEVSALANGDLGAFPSTDRTTGVLRG